MDSTAIAMEERVRIEDSVASAILNSASGSGLTEAGGDVAQGALGDAEVGFRVSSLESRPYFSRTPSCVPYDGRSSTSSPLRSRARRTKSEL
jgi:hypothetical protein